MHDAWEPVTTATFEAGLEELRRTTADPGAGVFGPDSLTWALASHSIIFLGAGRAALLQLAHPWVAHAIDQHSRTRTDPIGRFRGTFVPVYRMLFGSLEQALDSARAVHAVHQRITGRITETTGAFAAGTAYRANDVAALRWVYATLVETTVRVHESVLGPLADGTREAYYQESRRFAELFGVPSRALPADWDGFVAYNRQMWDSDLLAVGEVGRDLGQELFRLNPVVNPLLARYRILTSMMMPPRLRQAFDLPPATPANLAYYRKTVERLRRIYPRLPRRLRQVPPYLEAHRRLAGRRRPDPLTALLNRLLLGRSRVAR